MLTIRKKFLFIHVPKTAGNSIQNILKEYSEDEIVAKASHQDAVERFEIRGVHPGLKKHSTLRKYKARLEPELFSSLFKFSTIRNPWDRLISLYFTPSSGRT